MFSLYLLVGATALILGLLWLRSGDRRLAMGALGMIGLLMLLFVYNRLRSETVAEQMERKMEAMAAAVKARDLDGLFQHVSERFGTGSYNKSALRARAEQVLSGGELTDLIVWEFANAQVKEATATIDFKVNAKGSYGEVYLRCTATFVLDGDGEWRLGSYQLFDGVTNREIQI